MSPRPGPTFEIAEAEAEIAVKKSKPKKLKNIDVRIKINIYIKKKPITELKTSSSTDFPLKEVTKTPCGWVSFFICDCAARNNNWSLKIFTPPVVDPAQPPINIIINIITNPNPPQRLKLELLYPVPVKMDIMLKAAILIKSK